MIDFTNWLFEHMPPLNGAKNPQLAAVLGFFFGGIGLGIYFMSFVDFLIPILISILLFAVLQGLASMDTTIAWLVGAIIAGLWGFFRVVNSNNR